MSGKEVLLADSLLYTVCVCVCVRTKGNYEKSQLK